MGPVGYHLRLPEGSRIHNVFHVSLLHEFIADGELQHVPLPSEFCGDRPIAQPVEILESRTMWHDGKAVDHVLIRWTDGSNPSWEPLHRIRKHFPDLHLAGMVDSNRGELIRPTRMLRRRKRNVVTPWSRSMLI